MKIKVKDVYPVFEWSWDIEKNVTECKNKPRDYDLNEKLDILKHPIFKNYRIEIDDVCGICRGNYNGCCPGCKMPGESCPLVVGQCKHNFHYHCIHEWLDTPNSRGLCPMCRQEFHLQIDKIINEKCKETFEKLAEQNMARRLLTNDNDEDNTNNIQVDDNIPDNTVDEDPNEEEAGYDYDGMYDWSNWL